MAIGDALPLSLAESRSTDVVAGHWPVFAILTAVLAATGVFGLLVRRRTGGALTAGSDGGALSFAPAPDDYGRKAVELALDWLDDRASPGPPPPIASAHFDVAVRQDALARRGFTLPQIYLEAARQNTSLFP